MNKDLKQGSGVKSEVSPADGKPKLGEVLGLIKICGDPHCDAIFHNCPKKHTKCNDCGGRLIQINEDTFWKKFSNYFFQYDFKTMEYFRPMKMKRQLSLDFT